jgi:hypothetical protein
VRFSDYAALDAISKGSVQPSSTTNTVPYAIFHSKLTSPVSHFLPFGQWGYVTNNSPHKRPLELRALLRRCLMAPNMHHYAVLDQQTFRVSICRIPEFHPFTPQKGPTTSTFPITCQALGRIKVPRNMRQAMHLLDAAKWRAAHDQEIDRHVSILKTWHYERPLPTDRPIPYTFTYKVKTDHPGQPSTYKARCTIRGDLMRSPGSLFVE